jgi:hypothetical protein
MILGKKKQTLKSKMRRQKMKKIDLNKHSSVIKQRLRDGLRQKGTACEFKISKVYSQTLKDTMASLLIQEEKFADFVFKKQEEIDAMEPGDLKCKIQMHFDWISEHTYEHFSKIVDNYHDMMNDNVNDDTKSRLSTKRKGMNNLFLLVLFVVAISFITVQTSCNGEIKRVHQPDVNIAELYAKQSLFADSLITLKNVKVKNCQSILNYSKAIITDNSDSVIMLISDKPFKKGETTNVTGRMIVVYQKNNQNCIVFVDNSLKPINDLLQVIVNTMRF